MKPLLSCLLITCAMHSGYATLNVHMFSTPVTVTGVENNDKYYYFDPQNDGIDDARITISNTSIDNFNIFFESINDQYIDVENINYDDAIAYNCGASFGAGEFTDAESDPFAIGYLAKESGDAQFDGKGPRYLALRKDFGGYGVYGWIKVECAADAS